MLSLTHSFIGGAFTVITGRPKASDGGVIFVLDMGEPVRIVDLARDLIRLSGLSEEQVPIVYTVLRPGERLHESLMHDHETIDRTGHPSIMRVRASSVGTVGAGLDKLLAELTSAAQRHDDDQVREILRKVAPLSRPAATTSNAHARKPGRAAAAPRARQAGDR